MGVYQKHNSLSRRTYNSIIYDDFKFHSNFHKNIEFVYVMDGELQITVETTTETMKKGQMAIILPMCVHSFSTADTSKVWVGVFSNDYISEFASFISGKTSKKLSFKVKDTTYVERFIEHLDELNDFSVKGFLYTVCGEFINRCSLFESDVKKGGIFHTAMEYISKNYLNDITLSSMAAELNYEEHYLSRVLHEHTGVNLRQLINGYRIELAKELLVKGNLTVSEVALQSGFKGIRNFNRVFKQTVGLEPSLYAESMKS
jgi:AraC-like DNA-binding protein